jgi:BlaI family transcriptional regulator, penicillinase repressor
MLTDENMRVTEPKWECYFAGSGPSRCVLSQCWRLLAYGTDIPHLVQLFGPNNLPVVAENAGAFADQPPLRREEYPCIFFLQCSQQCRTIYDICSRIRRMALPKLSKLDLQIMDALWSRGALSIREIQESFPEPRRPAYTTVQTIVYRLETKKAVRRAKKISNAHIFEAVISRSAAQRRLIDDLLGLFGGQTQPVMAHLIESGKLTLEDVHEAEKILRKLAKKEKAP